MKQDPSLRIRNPRTSPQAGVGLIETLVALCLLMIAAAGIMTMATVAMSTTETQGHLAARTAEYAQDKMEQLLALGYQDTCTDTTQFPAVVSCGVGTGMNVGGGLNPNGPVAGYTDYVDINGNPVAAGAAWEYIRVWQVTQAAPNLKQISVLTQARHAVGQTALLPRATVVCMKSFPF